MKRWFSVMAVCLALVAGHADAAKRFGGGKSFGQQSSNVTQRQAAPVAPTQGVNATPKSPAPATPAVAATKKPWGAMLGGLAAGLGLAWLANSLGLSEAMGQFMMFALLALVVMMAVGWFMRRKTQAVATNGSPFAFQGAGSSGQTPVPASYRPENVGNDASARPWERSAPAAFEAATLAATGSMIGSGLLGAQTWGIPAGFDSEGFLTLAKANFVSLQAAWDKSDIPALRVMMTDTMLKEIQAQLAEREAHTGGPVNLTEVVMIEAHLLGIEDLGNDYMASVEFSGMIREEPSSGPSPFREVWNMIKSKNGSNGWLVAGVQALQ
ncbi:MAG: TIM44-like domain-containing protein [Betaproteobacteria bacterium]|nr:TIM44-like domain-containing protein [Betaproteobacteria bacterium]NCP82397.1 TIM44-like domain-containing protein [Rhodoferax sp.]NCS60705.1 TIM44-like domain-containing protein [Rhodoferax sp.]PIZ21832.1 MAG: transporter [Comamonadaceae bacterium CG_4_10_14_0_8_um_filter_57_29]PJC16286.1 MAG: transporter [Comamonadaceae bacterium CG_4_9_14_0_8_um_filter_57_21]